MPTQSGTASAWWTEVAVVLKIRWEFARNQDHPGIIEHKTPLSVVDSSQVALVQAVGDKHHPHCFDGLQTISRPAFSA
ncbi:hypothetical protein F6P96_22845 (plasmid) [Escherichia coli]|nr:hypothetical protein F6P96_22845 [Escherichia coli]